LQNGGFYMNKICLLVLIAILGSTSAQAQYSAQKEAMYIATLKAVVDYKINDEENLRDIESLRENERFKRRLMDMMAKLSNNRTKNSTNNKVYNILLKAGKDVYNTLN